MDTTNRLGRLLAERVLERTGGLIYLSVDDNTNQALGRMLLIDPVSLSYSVYATNGPIGNYLPAATNAGCYSHALNRAVILDTGGRRAAPLLARGIGRGVGARARGPDLVGGGSAEQTNVIEVPFGIFGGLANYGVGTPGCNGAQVMGANSAPVVNAPNFRLTTTSAPASALGLCLVTDAADAVGSDPFFIGILLHVDLFASTQVVPIDMQSNGFGFGLTTTNIPLSPFCWDRPSTRSRSGPGASATASPFNLSSSNGLAITIM